MLKSLLDSIFILHNSYNIGSLLRTYSGSCSLTSRSLVEVILQIHSVPVSSGLSFPTVTPTFLLFLTSLYPPIFGSERIRIKVCFGKTQEVGAILDQESKWFPKWARHSFTMPTVKKSLLFEIWTCQVNVCYYPFWYKVQNMLVDIYWLQRIPSHCQYGEKLTKFNVSFVHWTTKCIKTHYVSGLFWGQNTRSTTEDKSRDRYSRGDKQEQRSSSKNA